MINRNRHNRVSIGLCVIACAGMSLLLAACSSEEPQQVVVAPAPPPPPPPPAPLVTPIDQLMMDLNIDPRVVLPEERAPDNNIDRKAVLVFFDAIARGNAQSLKGMLPLTDQLELAALVDSGAWKATVDSIQRIEVQTGTNSLSQKCALAVIEVGKLSNMTFQPQLWYYTTADEDPIFEAAPSPPGIMDKLSGDWIAAWHQVLEAEMALAMKPEEDLSVPQKNLDTGGSSQSASQGGGTNPFGGGGGGGRKLRDPKGPKVPSPGE